MSMTVEQIAALVGGRLVGDGAAIISGVNGIEEAGAGELVFVRDAKYARHLASTRASAVLIQKVPEDCPIPAIEVGHPDVAFLMVLKHFEQALVVHPSGIHPAAVVSPTATLGVNISLGPNVCIEDGAIIGNNTVFYAGVYIGRGTTVGADCVFYPNVVVREQCSIGARCLFQSGAIIGSDGFGFAPAGGQWIKVPQIGRVVIGDDVEIGSATCVDRATFGETRIGSGTKIDNLVQVGHNVRIGEHCAIAGTCGIAGSAKIGNHVRIGANSGIAGHIEIGDGATIAARAGVTNSVEAGRIVSGFPAIDHTEQRRVMVGQRKVPELLRRVKELERKIQALEDTQHGESADHR